MNNNAIPDIGEFSLKCVLSAQGLDRYGESGLVHGHFGVFGGWNLNSCFQIAAVDLKNYALDSPLVIGNESVCKSLSGLRTP
jgi:hypothetical protein